MANKIERNITSFCKFNTKIQYNVPMTNGYTMIILGLHHRDLYQQGPLERRFLLHQQ